jgi:hypothetical protein
MKSSWLVVALAALAVMAAGSADARHRHKTKLRCIERPAAFSWTGFLSNPKPGPNGCSPPVYAYGQYIGQDPDPFIRLQLRRDPDTGYSSMY